MSQKIATFYDKNYEKMVAYSFRFVKDDEAARNVVADCFIALLQKQDDLQDDISSYVYAVVRGKSLNYLRDMNASKRKGFTANIDEIIGLYDSFDMDENLEASKILNKYKDLVKRKELTQRSIDSFMYKIFDVEPESEKSAIAVKSGNSSFRLVIKKIRDSL